MHCKAADTMYILKWLSAQLMDLMVAPHAALSGRLPGCPVTLIAGPGPLSSAAQLLVVIVMSCGLLGRGIEHHAFDGFFFSPGHPTHKRRAKVHGLRCGSADSGCGLSLVRDFLVNLRWGRRVAGGGGEGCPRQGCGIDTSVFLVSQLIFVLCVFVLLYFSV